MPLASPPLSILQHFSPPGTRHKGCLSLAATPAACQAPPVPTRERGGGTALRGTAGCAERRTRQPGAQVCACECCTRRVTHVCEDRGGVQARRCVHMCVWGGPRRGGCWGWDLPELATLFPQLAQAPVLRVPVPGLCRGGSGGPWQRQVCGFGIPVPGPMPGSGLGVPVLIPGDRPGDPPLWVLG